MRKRYKLDCQEWNDRHVKFVVFDPKGANCGMLTVETQDVINFVQHSWGGDIFWNGKMPEDIVLATAATIDTMTDTEKNMKEIIDRIVKKIGDARRRQYTVVPCRNSIGSDGKEYRFGFPNGVTATGRYSEPFFVFQTREGTTVGQRYATEQEAMDANERHAKRAEDEMRAALERMTPEEVQRQADYWLKGEQ